MCAMKFSHELRYAAPADDVHAMLTEQEFRERVCDANRAVAHRVEVMQEIRWKMHSLRR